ncbi:MAG: tetratricopeptide repeat protein [Phycisphaerae bacterium]
MKNTNRRIILWYRLNEGNWRQGGRFNADAPIKFSAPQDGIYDFALEPDNDVPAPTTRPADQLSSTFRCMVDFNQPVLQIEDVNCKNGLALVRWHAFDNNFSDRPIEIYLQSDPKETFLGKFPNKGIAVLQIDPKDLPAKIKVIALDRAGNYGIDFSKPIPKNEQKRRDREGAIISPTTKPQRLQKQSTPTQPAIASHVNPEAMREYKIAAGYRRRGDLNLALVHLKHAVDLDPKMIDARIDLADVLNSLERYNEAADSYLLVLAIDQRNIKAWQGLAIVRLNQSQYQQAVSHLEKALELDDKNVQAWLSLGDAYWNLGQWNDAKSAWYKARDLLAIGNNTRLKPAINARLKLIK